MLLRILPLLSCAVLAWAAPVEIELSTFQPSVNGVPAGWRTWAARPEIAPRTFIDSVHYRRGSGSLAISGNGNAAAYGGWEYPVSGIEPGKWYRFTAYYRAEALQHERLQVVSRLDWTKPDGSRAGQPDYAYKTERQGEWTRVSLDAPAPKDSAKVNLQLFCKTLRTRPFGGMTFRSRRFPRRQRVRFEWRPSTCGRAIHVPPKRAFASSSTSSGIL